MNDEPTNPTAARVEHMKCPACGEILPLERDAENMTILPTCACGKRIGLADLFGQMSDAMKGAQ